jgi:L-lactate dehydrogenase complex protein LldG
MFSMVATSSWRFGIAQRLAGLFSRIPAPVSGWLHLPAFTGWGYSRDFPKPAMRPFRDRFHELDTIERIEEAEDISIKVEEDEELEDESSSASQVNALSRFEQELSELGGTVSCCQEADLTQEILNYLNEAGIDRIQAWKDSNFPTDILASLKEGGIQVQEQPDDSIRAGLTGAMAGIAETGTILIPGGIGKPLTASLLPEIHMAILHSEDIYNFLPDTLQIPQVKAASSVTLVSGPSRTADIEMTLSIGVHGPGKLHVFCILPPEIE